VAPSNAYPTADGAEVVIAGNADGVFSRLCALMGRPELAADERFVTHAARGRHAVELDALVGAWTSGQDAAALLDALEEAGVPAGRIHTAADMLTDPQYLARDMVLRRTAAQGWEVPMPGVVPAFSHTPGSVRSTGPVLGAHTRAVVCGLGGLDGTAYDALASAGVVADTTGPATG
jgi:crotonobetainyl-CoA:carnitine CoA-transferase CaiB-like acyl-CoA transferase